MCVIAGGQRCQKLHAVDIHDIKFVEDKRVILVYEKLKQTKPETHMKPVEFKLFTCDLKLCVINNLKAYLEKQSLLERIQDYLLVIISQIDLFSKTLWLDGVNIS